MAKVCKFCNLENEDTEEFCTRCSAKLPTYCQYEAGLMDEKTGPKKRFKFDFIKVLKFTVPAILIIAVLSVFFPTAAAAKGGFLPEYKKHRSDFTAIQIFVTNLQTLPDDMSFNGKTTADAASLYLTSLLHPKTDVQKLPVNVIPRISVKTPPQAPDKISIAKHYKILFIPARLELIFKYDKDKWLCDSWKFCNLPAFSFNKDTVCKTAFKEFKSDEKIKKLFSPSINVQRSKMHIILNKKQNNTASAAPLQLNRSTNHKIFCKAAPLTNNKRSI